MNSDLLVSNLHKGIAAGTDAHIQGFPDAAAPALRGIYALIWGEAREWHTDPRWKAAALLSLAAVAGGAILVTEDTYACNLPDVDFPAANASQNAVADLLTLLAERYYGDVAFTEKVIAAFSAGDDAEMIARVTEYSDVVQRCYGKCRSQEEADLIDILRWLSGYLTKLIPETADKAPVPTPWDHEAWLTEFLPIWNRRIRYEQHQFRARYYKQHVALVEKACYISQSGKEVQIPWDAMERMQASKMYSQELHFQPPEKVYDTTVEVWQMDCLEAAKIVQQETAGCTAVLNLANRQNPGGGVFSGSGAQEESCFLRSDYYTALYPFAEYAHQYDLPKAEAQYPLDRDFGGMWTEGVTIFRGRELEGYPLLDEPWKTNFIAVAAINHPATIEENGEIRLHPDMVPGTLNKLRTIMNIAADNGMTNLVLGALGCGAFKNPPKHVAELFRQVLEEPAFKGRFDRVVFSIFGAELCDTFAAVFGCEVKR